jgi:hypothetical protein
MWPTNPADIGVTRAGMVVGVIAHIVSLVTASRIAFLVFAICVGVAIGGSVRRWRLRRKSN